MLQVKLNEVNIAGSPAVCKMISQLDATLNHHNRIRLRKIIVTAWKKAKDGEPSIALVCQ